MYNNLIVRHVLCTIENILKLIYLPKSAYLYYALIYSHKNSNKKNILGFFRFTLVSHKLTVV